LAPNMIDGANTAAVLILGSSYTNTYNYGSLEFQMEASVGGGFNQRPNRMRLGVQTAYSEPDTATGIYIDANDRFYNARQTFDDGGGNMTVAGNLAVNGELQLKSSGVGILGLETNGVYLDSAFMNVNFQSNASSTNTWGVKNTSGVGAFSVSNGNVVTTTNNTLDNGSGAATIAGNLTVTSNTLVNSVGDDITLPATSGTIALTHNYFMGSATSTTFTGVFSRGITSSGVTITIPASTTYSVQMQCSGEVATTVTASISPTIASSITTYGNPIAQVANNASTNSFMTATGLFTVVTGSTAGTITFNVYSFSSYTLTVLVNQLL